jgi:hypothetical protein
MADRSENGPLVIPAPLGHLAAIASNHPDGSVCAYIAWAVAYGDGTSRRPQSRQHRAASCSAQSPGAGTMVTRRTADRARITRRPALQIQARRPALADSTRPNRRRCCYRSEYREAGESRSQQADAVRGRRLVSSPTVIHGSCRAMAAVGLSHLAAARGIFCPAQSPGIAAPHRAGRHIYSKDPIP